jgi:hypothetical protein
MNRAHRTLLLLVSTFAAGGAAWIFHGPNFGLVLEAPVYAVAGMALVAWALWLTLLLPIWLPAVVPSAWLRTFRFVSIICGSVLLLFVAAALVLYAHLGNYPGPVIAGFVGVAALMGIGHLTRRPSGPPPAAAEFQR